MTASHDDLPFDPAERERLEQELLELEFGCHDDPEALRRRLQDEPALRELQRRVRHTRDVLARAAQPAAARLELPSPRRAVAGNGASGWLRSLWRDP